MSWNSWMKLGKPKNTLAKKRKSKTGQPRQSPPSWMADRWDKAKRIGGATVTLGMGVALGSMIPFSASKATERNINRMQSYQPHRES